ncbi:uncharacterized protein LOC122422713 [Cervus canadensis]|uniref:uncharacterized protein LOC122422713 n=1 Tax=Cervus canadensis TaxID=1574408 RepID=UPI001CA34DEC|nr:uncharacterized protein LOC122422713 [Cervus canadensis]
MEILINNKAPEGFSVALAPAWAPPHPTPTNFCLPLALYFNGLAAEGGGGEGYLSGKQERRKSSRLLPANPEAGTLSNAALPGIHQPRLRRRRRRRRSQHQLLSVGWSEQRRGTAAGTLAEDALGSSPDHIVGEQPLPLPAGGVGGGGRPELGLPLSQVLARPCHSRLPEKRRKRARIERLDGGGHAGSRRLCALGAAGAEGAAAAGPGALSLCAPGRPKSDAPLRVPPRPLPLPLPLRLRLPLLKEDSAQPNS